MTTIAPYRTTKISFTVLGQPATAGSKKAFVLRRKDGSFVTRPNGSPVVNVVDDNKRGKDWRSMVISAAREQYSGPLLDGAIKLSLCFIRPRPKGHFRTGRHAGELKHDAPKWPTTKPDCTKMLRAVEDALKGIVWRDDAQVVQQHVGKRWGEPSGCVVTIEELRSDEQAEEEPMLFR